MQLWTDTRPNCVEPWRPPGLNHLVLLEHEILVYLCQISKDTFYSWLGLKGLRRDTTGLMSRAKEQNRVPSVRVHTLGMTAGTVVAAASARLIVQSHFHNKKTQSANSSKALRREASLWVLHAQRRKNCHRHYCLNSTEGSAGSWPRSWASCGTWILALDKWIDPLKNDFKVDQLNSSATIVLAAKKSRQFVKQKKDKLFEFHFFYLSIWIHRLIKSNLLKGNNLKIHWLTDYNKIQ